MTLLAGLKRVLVVVGFDGFLESGKAVFRFRTVEEGPGQFGHYYPIHFYKHILQKNKELLQSLSKRPCLQYQQNQRRKTNEMALINRAETLSTDNFIKMLASRGKLCQQCDQQRFLNLIQKLRPIILAKIGEKQQQSKQLQMGSQRWQKRRKELQFSQVISVKRFISNDLVANLHKDMERYEGLNIIYQDELKKPKQLRIKNGDRTQDRNIDDE